MAKANGDGLIPSPAEKRSLETKSLANLLHQTRRISFLGFQMRLLAAFPSSSGATTERDGRFESLPGKTNGRQGCH